MNTEILKEKSTKMQTLRNDYTRAIFTEDSALDSPFHQFEAWLDEAFESGNSHANAMVLSTAGSDGMPDSRIVLLRNIRENAFTFFTNYKSKKARDLKENNKASLLFFWPELERQVRLDGAIERLPESESDEYFASRPFESQVGAWASRQSQVIKSRKELEDAYEEELARFNGKSVPRPTDWGGYALTPERFEFWQGRPSRLHDRIQYRSISPGKWTIERLMP